MQQRHLKKTKATGLLAAAVLGLAACGAGPGGGGEAPEEGAEALTQEEAVAEIDAVVEQFEAGELEYDVSADSDPTIEALQEVIPQPEGYPSRAIEVLIGFGEGGGSDNYGRNVGIDAQRIMGQDIIFNNIPGASGEVALGQMFSQPADGYVISTVITNQVINEAIGSQPYDFVEDVAFIIRQQGPTETYWVRDDSPFQTFQDMLDFAVANPGELTVSGSGPGGDDEVRLLALGAELGTSFNYVPLDSLGDRTTTLLGGDVQVMHETAGTVIDLYEDGQIRPLAYGGDIVFEDIDPEIPAVADLDLPVPIGRWRGIVAPPEVDQEIIDYLHNVFYAAAQLPSYTEYEAEFFQDVAGGYLNSEEFEAESRRERDEVATILEEFDL